ncbi:MAG: hypothetical protein PARBA_00111 [Parabacteroides sp.]
MLCFWRILGRDAVLEWFENQALFEYQKDCYYPLNTTICLGMDFMDFAD